MVKYNIDYVIYNFLKKKVNWYCVFHTVSPPKKMILQWVISRDLVGNFITNCQKIWERKSSKGNNKAINKLWIHTWASEVVKCNIKCDIQTLFNQWINSNMLDSLDSRETTEFKDTENKYGQQIGCWSWKKTQIEVKTLTAEWVFKKNKQNKNQNLHNKN